MTYNNPMPAAPVYGNYSPLSPMGTQYMQQPQAAPAPQYATMDDLNALREELMRKGKGGKADDK